MQFFAEHELLQAIIINEDHDVWAKKLGRRFSVLVESLHKLQFFWHPRNKTNVENLLMIYYQMHLVIKELLLCENYRKVSLFAQVVKIFKLK